MIVTVDPDNRLTFPKLYWPLENVVEAPEATSKSGMGVAVGEAVGVEVTVAVGTPVALGVVVTVGVKVKGAVGISATTVWEVVMGLKFFPQARGKIEKRVKKANPVEQRIKFS